MDNASRVILDVEVTEPNLHQEGQVAGEMLEERIQSSDKFLSDFHRIYFEGM